MARTTLSVSDLDVKIDEEGIVRVVNIPADAAVVITKPGLEQLLTEVSEAIMQAYSEREPLE